MKNFCLITYLVLTLGLYSMSCGGEESITDPGNGIKDSLEIEGYELVWNDEFNYDGALDDAKWDYDIGGDGWGNNESQYYTNDSVNVRVNNGKMTIEAHYYENATINYTSARVVTRYKGDWKYGRIEVKAKLPPGRGTWPAIWMLPTDWVYGGWPSSGEIDIMEHVGYDPNVVHGTVHTEAYNHKIGTQVGSQLKITTALTDFHIYAIEWAENKIDFFIDDNKYFTFNNENKSFREWPFDKRFHLIMNIAIGGSWGGVQGIDNSIFPVKMDVEYVRVYEKSE